VDIEQKVLMERESWGVLPDFLSAYEIEQTNRKEHSGSLKSQERIQMNEVNNSTVKH
jgi:hypothetical protein